VLRESGGVQVGVGAAMLGKAARQRVPRHSVVRCAGAQENAVLLSAAACP